MSSFSVCNCKIPSPHSRGVGSEHYSYPRPPTQKSSLHHPSIAESDNLKSNVGFLLLLCMWVKLCSMFMYQETIRGLRHRGWQPCLCPICLAGAAMEKEVRNAAASVLAELVPHCSSELSSIQAACLAAQSSVLLTWIRCEHENSKKLPKFLVCELLSFAIAAQVCLHSY